VHYNTNQKLSAATRSLTGAHYHFNRQDHISEEPHGERDVGPTYGFLASPEVGPRATVSIPQTGYPHVQTSSQDRGQGVNPRAATRLLIPDRYTPLRWAPVLSHVPRLQTPPPSSRGLRRRHASHALDLTPPQKWVPVSPRVICLQTPSPHAKGLRCWHMSHGTPWAMGRENKERLSCNRHIAGLTCY
jgi:hypothetical protein